VLLIASVLLAGSVLTLWLATIRISAGIEAQFPPAGAFVTIDGAAMHYIDQPADVDADLPTIVFIHGASGNARDLAGAFAEPLKGRARMIFVDRPGSGYSQRGGPGMEPVEAQAKRIARMLEMLGVDRAIIAGHSLGGAVALAFALEYPQMTAGLMLMAPVSHPWPGAGITWYYDIANTPVVGDVFCALIAIPAGSLKYAGSVRSVFAPDPMPADYAMRSGTQLVLRPRAFAWNAADVGALYDGVTRISPRYGEIAAPTVVVTGDSDTVVRADIHSAGIKRDIKGAKLVWIKSGGHMPTYAHTGTIIAELEALARRIAAR
jgi:pimeloyl-ACP methyl ester carboxylesterase